ncbi:MAG: HAD hydrolase family protein [Anaerolineae bacterium]
MNKIRLVLIDVDGCLTEGEARPWDFEVLEFVAALNRRARVDATQFAVTLCTGRQEPYVEVFMQAIAGFLPAIYENGGGLFFPSPYHFAESPAIDEKWRELLSVLRRILRRTVVEAGIGQFQPGKETCITLFPARPEISLDEVLAHTQRALGGQLDDVVLRGSASSVEILKPGIDKGTGLEWLSRETGIPLHEMAGIGDSEVDLPFLRKIQYAAAPANATAAVRAAVHYVSPYKAGRGVMEILQRIGTIS